MVAGGLLQSCVRAVLNAQVVMVIRCAGEGKGWLCQVSRHHLPMVLAVMVVWGSVEVAWLSMVCVSVSGSTRSGQPFFLELTKVVCVWFACEILVICLWRQLLLYVAKLN